MPKTETEKFTYLPPYDDGVFKALMTHPDAKNALRSVISSFTNIDVQQVDVLGSETPINDKDEKQERFDVNCVVDRIDGTGGRQIEVELQASPMDDDNAHNGHANLKCRSVFNLCDLFAKQKGRGIAYVDLMPSIQITICNYTVLPDEESFINFYTMRNERGRELNRAIKVIFVELSKLGKISKKPVSEMNDMEMWAVFLKYADKPKYEQVIKNIMTEKEEIMEAVQILSNISKDEHERARFRARRKFQQDMEHNKAVAKQRMVAAKAQGIAIGEARGKTEERARLLKSFISNGFPLEAVIKSMNLTDDEIKQLLNK